MLNGSVLFKKILIKIVFHLSEILLSFTTIHGLFYSQYVSYYCFILTVSSVFLTSLNISEMTLVDSWNSPHCLKYFHLECCRSVVHTDMAITLRIFYWVSSVLVSIMDCPQHCEKYCNRLGVYHPKTKFSCVSFTSLLYGNSDLYWVIL